MNLICIGAHPDDPEVFAGGVMTLFARAGHRVLAVSLTNGDIGHHEMGGGALAQRRATEARAAAEIGGYTSLALDHHDGELVADLPLRREVVRLIREHEADVVLTHRTNDYHPDHRYTSQAVQDAAFMVTVPQFCPDVPALRRNPIFLYLFDPFTQPAPFRADIVLPVDGVMDVKWRLLDAMASQFYEWLPWLDGRLEEVPPASKGETARRVWLEGFFGPELELPAQVCRERLRAQLGNRADAIRYVEAFQLCEYGSRPRDAVALASLFAPVLNPDGGAST